LRPIRAAPRHLLLPLLAILVIARAGVASAWTLSYHDPLRNPSTSKPLTCPDPDVVDAQAPATGYVLVCTSGLGRDAFPIYTSQDLVHWQPDGFVFPRGQEPWWAIPSTGRGAGGRFWAPELAHVGGRWVLYFAAAYSAAALSLQVPGAGPVNDGQMVVGVAWSSSLQGPWQSTVLHYRGQFNGLSAESETLGSAIDPSLLQDPATGQLYLFWSDQSYHIWAGALSPDGLTLSDQVDSVLGTSRRFECDPSTHHCTVEAPEPFFANGSYYLLYSGGSTWDSSYDVGVASAPAPLGPYAKLGHPILRQGGGFYCTGHTSHPIVGPDGNTYILYHARLRPGHQGASAQRYLMLGRVGWAHGWPTITPGPAW
jgi:beta-xylosidase